MANDTELLLKLKAVDDLTPVMAKAVAAMEAQTNAMVKAVDRISPAADAAKDKSGQLNTGMLNLAAGLSIANAAIEIGSKVWGKMSETIGQAISEAEEAEKTQNKLTGALISQGLYVEKNVAAIDKYVKSLEASKGVSGEQTQILIAQSIQMGLNIEQAEKMEEASRKLAVSQGIDANQAFQLLSSSIAGQTRGLAKIVPEVKNLTEAQLKSGAAAEIVSKALEAQYQLYSGSYSASVTKAENAVSNIYEAVGKMITQNPIVLKGIKAFGEYAAELAENLDDMATWIRGNQGLIEQFGNAVANTMKVGAAALGVWAVAAGIAAAPTVTLAGAIAVISAPVTLAIAAVAGLTAAFMKWPGLFDQIIGNLKMFAGIFIESMTEILDTAAKVAGVFDDDLAASLNRAKDGMQAYASKLQLAGSNQIDLGTAINETSVTVAKSVDQIKKEEIALDSNSKSTSANAATKQQLIQSYANIMIGNDRIRESLRLETQARDQELKNFENYLNSKTRLAISKEEERQLQLSKFRVSAIGGTGGEESTKANADSAIRAEEQKQAQLKVLRQKGVIDQKQLDEELFESDQRIRQAQLEAETAHQQQMADVLGNGPAGFEAQRALRQRKYDAETADQLAQAERLGASEDQLAEITKQRKLTNQAAEYELQKTHDQLMVAQATQAALMKAQARGETPEALELKLQAEEQAFQMKLQNMVLRAQQEGATQAELDAIREQQELEHLARRTEMEVSYYNNQAALHEKNGDDWEAFLARRNAAVAQQGAVMGNISAVQNSQYFKATNQALSDLSSLRSSKDKKQFEVGKAAAIAQATVQTFLGATQAFTSLSSIPIVGPILGAVAAAAAIASGMNQISQIKAQQFTGGQADSGLNAVPQALDGKSFVLSAGERVIQPTANRELTDFLEREKMSSQQGGTRPGAGAVNVTLNYNGLGSASDARKMAEILAKELRSMSEKGTPIISSKGIV